MTSRPRALPYSCTRTSFPFTGWVLVSYPLTWKNCRVSVYLTTLLATLYAMGRMVFVSSLPLDDRSISRPCRSRNLSREHRLISLNRATRPGSVRAKSSPHGSFSVASGDTALDWRCISIPMLGYKGGWHTFQRCI